MDCCFKMTALLASYIDATNLKPDATENDMREMAKQAMQLQVAAVCIPPVYVRLMSELLNGSQVKVCTVIGFPLAFDFFSATRKSAALALAAGADELDLVMNLGAMRAGDHVQVVQEIKSILQLKQEYAFLLKIIVETALWTPTELQHIVQLLSELSIDYIKTSTGFASRGASLEDIKTIGTYKRADVKIKASGGIKTSEWAGELIAAGAERLGTSSFFDLL